MSKFKTRTWMFESLIVFLILATVAVITGNKLVEWIGTFAVWFSFMHTQVSDRMAEKEAARVKADVECFRWTRRYLIVKEMLWLSYFLLHQSYAALVGVFLFLFYPFWRNRYRKSHPLGRKF